MKIKRGEIVAAVVVVCAVVGVWAFGQARSQVEESHRQAFETAHKEKYPMGETIALDSEEQDSCVDENGLAYSADFGWKGRMEVVVEKAVSYKDLSSIPGLDSNAFLKGDNAPNAVVVLTIKLSNIDAENIDGKDDNESPYEFNAGVFRLQGSLVDDQVILAGTGDLNPTPTNGLHFVLPKGQSAELVIAYGVHDSGDLSRAVLNIGAEGSGADKISVELSVEQAKGGDAK